MLLEKINGIKDLKKIPLEKLDALADEIRKIIIKTVTEKTGGHLASSLGAVDFTIAMHYVFNAPKDHIVWDVGHQGYAHKLLTGRLKDFHKIRQYKGLSGFMDPTESEYDTFYVGHAGPALSLADGLATARDMSKKTNRVVAVVGDASIASGMAFEAINNIGHHKRSLVAILNDNEMSISRNVGAMSKYFNKLITLPVYNKFKNKTGEFISHIPIIGKPIKYVVDKIQEYLKSIVLPAIIFEELGFRYVGPLDGHNIPQMVDLFRKLEYMRDRPVLVHLITKKGKGYKPAEENPTAFHGVAVSSKKIISFTQVFSETMVDLGDRDKKVVGITAAMRDGTGLKAFSLKHPDRFFDVGIAEQHAVAYAAGMAKGGYKPFVAIYSSFMQRALDQIIHDVALQGLPVRLCLDRAGIVGEDGPTHNGTFDISFLSMIPNLVFLSPKDVHEFRQMLYLMWKYEKGPIAIRYPRGAGIDEFPVCSGGAQLFNNETIVEGQEVTVLATGPVVFEAKKASEILRKEHKIGIRVVNCRCIKPLDETHILSVAKKSKLIITIEENVVRGGFGSSVNELLIRQAMMDKRIINMGLPDSFIEIGSQSILRDLMGITAVNIVKNVLKFYRKGKK